MRSFNPEPTATVRRWLVDAPIESSGSDLWEAAGFQTNAMIVPTTHPVAQQIVATAIHQFAESENVVNRLAWWAQHAHSSERWMQFELAFLIDRALAPAYAVACERNYVDIVIYDGADGGRTLDWIAGVELKWYANWWLEDAGAGLLADVAKHNKKQRPILALGIWLFVKPKTSSTRHAWISEQGRKWRDTTPEDIVLALKQKSDGKSPDIQEKAQCARHDEFESMTLLAAGYFNDASRPV